MRDQRQRGEAHEQAGGLGIRECGGGRDLTVALETAGDFLLCTPCDFGGPRCRVDASEGDGRGIVGGGVERQTLGKCEQPLLGSGELQLADRFDLRRPLGERADGLLEIELREEAGIAHNPELAGSLEECGARWKIAAARGKGGAECGAGSVAECIVLQIIRSEQRPESVGRSDAHGRRRVGEMAEEGGRGARPRGSEDRPRADGREQRHRRWAGLLHERLREQGDAPKTIRCSPHSKECRDALQQRIVFTRQRRQRVVEGIVALVHVAIAHGAAPEKEQPHLIGFEVPDLSHQSIAEVGTREDQFRAREDTLQYAQRLEAELMRGALHFAAADHADFADFLDSHDEDQLGVRGCVFELEPAIPLLPRWRLLRESRPDLDREREETEGKCFHGGRTAADQERAGEKQRNLRRR